VKLLFLAKTPRRQGFSLCGFAALRETFFSRKDAKVYRFAALRLCVKLIYFSQRRQGLSLCGFAALRETFFSRKDAKTPRFFALRLCSFA
jgi:hypothetical protein